MLTLRATQRSGPDPRHRLERIHMVTDKQTADETVMVELHHHPRVWSDGTSTSVYLFHCIGRPWGTKWGIRAIWTNRSVPEGTTTASSLLMKSGIVHSLETQLNRKLLTWKSSMIVWDSENGWDPQESSRMPTESYGICNNVKRCGSWSSILGDGLCVACFDARTSSARGGV